jgi:hypothetical protein
VVPDGQAPPSRAQVSAQLPPVMQVWPEGQGTLLLQATPPSAWPLPPPAPPVPGLLQDYAPIQLLQYVHEWARAFNEVRSGLRALIEARQAIGLSPPGIPELNRELRPVIAFGPDLPSEEVLRRFEEVRAVANRHLPDGVAAIEVWRTTEVGKPMRVW